jgi:hypothetical protein
MNKLGFLQNQRWTRLEVAIWLFALAFMATSGILLLTQGVGHWVLPVGGVIAASLGLMRYRAETEQKRRDADNHDE